MRTEKDHQKLWLRKGGIVFFSFFFVLLAGCSRSVTGSQEEFKVSATMVVTIIDQAGNPVETPVSFRVQDEISYASATIEESEFYIIWSDSYGTVSFSCEKVLTEGEFFSIVADVSSENFVSINYWTAYFKAEDAPARQVDVRMIVVPR